MTVSPAVSLGKYPSPNIRFLSAVSMLSYFSLAGSHAPVAGNDGAVLWREWGVSARGDVHAPLTPLAHSPTPHSRTYHSRRSCISAIGVPTTCSNQAGG